MGKGGVCPDLALAYWGGNGDICISRFANRDMHCNLEMVMREHRGMRPQDVVILLKLFVLADKPWRMVDIAQSLGISQSEVTQALERSRVAGLVSNDKRHLHVKALLEFLMHGIQYVFPERPGGLVRGIPTAHSAPPLSDKIVQGSEGPYVWPYEEGTERGQMIRPLFPSVPKAALQDRKLYELLALTDALRVGHPREKALAMKELENRGQQ